MWGIDPAFVATSRVYTAVDFGTAKVDDSKKGTFFSGRASIVGLSPGPSRMPTLTLRSVGVSYLIEGLEPSGLAPRTLLDALTGAYGLAVAPMSTPRTLQPLHDDAPPIDALIVDRRAVPWDDLRAWLETYVHESGCIYTAWADDGRDQTSATLHFHRL